MPAYAALLSLTQTLSQSPVVRQTEHHILGFLHEKHNFLLSFLEEDYAEKNSETFRCLEGRIRDVTYEAEDIIESRCLEGRIRDVTYEVEDIIESQILNQIRSESRIESHISNQIVERKCEGLQKIIKRLTQCICGTTLSADRIVEQKYEGQQKTLSADRIVEQKYEGQQKTLSPDRIVAQKYEGLQKIIGELDNILEELVKMKDIYHTEDQPRRKSLSSASSRSVSTNMSTMVGFHDELMQIKDQLIGTSSKLEIISIVGMGGIGKTTLARNVYDDSRMDYFHTRAWITVSQNYHIQEMLTGLLGCTGNLRYESYQEDIGKLAEHLYQSLKGRKYLIVMDDVWDTKAWDDVERLFPDDKNGSRIILTTRLSDVAVYANPSCHICRLNLQSSEESWKILQHKVFGEENCPLELEEVGKEIAENCKGLPLAIAVIGGLLYKGERTLDYWNQIKQNVNYAITSTDDHFMEIISLSYNNLPHHLRACFLYMGVFPEDHKIRISVLIKLWVAEGFVKPVESKSLEEVAEKYLEDLVDRNMILVLERTFYGEIKICGIHDLVRDLCVRKAQEEKFLQVVDRHIEFSPESIQNQRRVSVHSDTYYDLAKINVSRVRSLVYIYRYPSWSKNSSVKLPMLRVLHSSNGWLEVFPDKLGELINLRYMALNFRSSGHIPALVSDLLNLQTLIIGSTGIFNHLPAGIWGMPQLRHILIRNCFLPQPSGAEIWNEFVPLENLQTLDRVMNLKFTKEVLRMMPNLKKLAADFNCTDEFRSYCIDNLFHLHQLEDLKCFFSNGYLSRHRFRLQGNFRLPKGLKKLTLCGNWRLSPENMAVLGLLPNLQGLKLKSIAFLGQVWETREGEFCKLKFLRLRRTDLKHWNADETHFRNLQRITLVSCHELVEIPSRIGKITTLQEIKLRDCSRSAVSSAKSIREEQEELGNNDLQIIYY